MGRLSNLRVVSAVLTTLARGYTNAELIAQYLFPFVFMDVEAGKVPAFGKEAFKIYNTLRAIRANSNRINPEGRSEVDVILDEHDLEYPIDYREEEEDIFPLEQHATNVVVEAIRLLHEKQCADLAQATSTYAASNRVALSGASCWSDPSSDMIGQIETGKEAVRSKIGRYPNLMVLGAVAMQDAKKNTAVLDRIKYTQKGVVTPELLASVVDMPQVHVGRAVFANDAGTFADIWGDNCILAYVPGTAEDKRTMFEPSFAYTFRKKGKPEVDTRDEGGKLHLVRNTDIFKAKVVGAEAGYLISNTRA